MSDYNIAGINNTAGICLAVFASLVYDKTCRYKILGYRIEYEGEALYIFDLKIPEIFEDRKRPRRNSVTLGENKNQGPVEQAEQTSWRKGFYAGDIANTFSVPVEAHRAETEFKQMDGYVSIGMLNGSQKEQSNQTVVGEEINLSEKPEVQEFVIDKAEIESRAQTMAATYGQ